MGCASPRNGASPDLPAYTKTPKLYPEAGSRLRDVVGTPMPAIAHPYRCDRHHQANNRLKQRNKGALLSFFCASHDHDVSRCSAATQRQSTV